MKPCYLIDPWLLDLKPEDDLAVRFNRLTSINRLNDLHAKYGMSLVKFVDNEFMNAFMANPALQPQRQDSGEVGRLLAHAFLNMKLQGPLAEIVDTPCPALSEECTLSDNWLRALGEHGCDDSSPNWRRPIIVFPEKRKDCWPNSSEKTSELKFKIDGLLNAVSRNLVCIDTYDQHAYFEPDLDPWRIGAVGMPVGNITGAVGERREAFRRLPRPLDLLPLQLTFTQIWGKLQNRLDWSCGKEGRAYYIPPEDWDPRTICRDDWRGRKIFPTVSLPKSGRYQAERGIVDREGRIWVWDKLKNHHWDVQLPGGRHTNVTHDGSL